MAFSISFAIIPSDNSTDKPYATALSELPFAGTYPSPKTIALKFNLTGSVEAVSRQYCRPRLQ